MLQTQEPPTAAPLVELRRLAAQHLACEEEAWARAYAERLERERGQAAEAAARFVGNFPATLKRVLTAGHWAGYPSLEVAESGTQSEPCAVAYLGEGLFLHYTARSPSYHSRSIGHDHRLVLLAPCPCGNYLEADAGGNDLDIAQSLTDIERPDGCVKACTPCGSYPYDSETSTTTNQEDQMSNTPTTPTALQILADHSVGVAFVVEEPVANGLGEFVFQLGIAAGRMEDAGIQGADSLETAATYLADMVDIDDQPVLLEQAVRHLQGLGDMVEEYRQMAGN